MSLTTYLKETKAELQHVSWPTQRQIVSYTAVVVFIALLTAFFLGFFDFIFTWALNTFVI